MDPPPLTLFIDDVKTIISEYSHSQLFVNDKPDLSSYKYLSSYYNRIKSELNSQKGGKIKQKRKKKKRKIYIGPKGGKYYIVKGSKRYIK